jgi:phage replication initiation protein
MQVRLCVHSITTRNHIQREQLFLLFAFFVALGGLEMVEKKKKPPSRNTGVQNTYGVGLKALVDWVSATFPQRKEWREVAELLGLKPSEFKVEDKGLNGYRKQARRGHIILFFDGGAPDMGVHLQLGGQGCREYEAENLLDWPSLFVTVFDDHKEFDIVERQEVKQTVAIGKGGHFTRLDLAIDDQVGYFTPKQVIRKLERGLVSSRFKGWRMMKSGKIKKESGRGEETGTTVYLGSDKSDIKIRIYDKAQERRAAGKELPEGVEHWVRTEVELRDQRADLAAKHVIEAHAYGGTPVGVVIAGVLRNYLTFYRREGTDTNKSRWERWDAWELFLGEAAKLKLTVKAPDRTMETRRAWIDRQTAKTLGMLFMAYDSDLNWLVDTLTRGMELCEDRDVNEVEAYQRNRHLIDLELAREQLANIPEQERFRTFDNYLIYRTELEGKIRELELKTNESSERDWPTDEGLGDEIHAEW